MPVLVEAISVIVRTAAIHAKYAGGWTTFLLDVPNQTLCFDDDLVRVGFMSPVDVKHYANALAAKGLKVADGKCTDAVDFVVIDQREGPTAQCDWAEFYRLTVLELGGTISVCRLRGNQSHRVALPENWNYNSSLSRKHEFVPNEKMQDQLRFLRRDGELDVYLNIETGSEVFIGRANSSEFADLEAVCASALALDSQIEAARNSDDDLKVDRICDEIRNKLLPRAKALCTEATEHQAFAFFAYGLVLRVLKDYQNAIEQFRQSLVLSPNTINTLLEITLCFSQAGQLIQAETYARKAVSVEPTSASAWGNLAMTLIEADKKQEAFEAISRAVKLDPNDEKNKYIFENFHRY